MYNISMKQYSIRDILVRANLNTEEDLDYITLFNYLNDGIIELNTSCSLKLPNVDETTFSNYQNTQSTTVSFDYTTESVMVYNIANNNKVQDIIITTNNSIAKALSTYISFRIRQTDGYLDNENTYFKQWNMDRYNFCSNMKVNINPEYVLSSEDSGKVVEGTVVGNKFLTRTPMW